MKPTLTGTLVFLNAVGAALYLVVASRAWWLEPELADIPGASGGGPIVWYFVTRFTLGLVTAINLSVFLFQLTAFAKRRNWKLGFAALFIPFLWALTIGIDFAHH